MRDLCLRGIAWNHSRAFPPLVAASQRFEELHPEVRIIWEKRSLDEFGHAGLAALARSYDLLIIDHPMLGEVHRDGILIDLLPRLQPATLPQLEADALGPCLDSYRYANCLYALPVDAAAPAASLRVDLLERNDRKAPATWNEMLDLARNGLVRMPGFPADLFLNFMGMCVSRGGMRASGEQLFDPAIATQCLEEFRELASLMPPEIYAMNPVDIYEAMASGDNFAYCPFAYTYSNYSRQGFAARTLLFSNPVALRGGILLRTVLGGTGIAISANCANADPAIDFCLFVAGADCQSHIYGICGGQPASRAAWRDPMLNGISNNFFERTRASIEAACVRPRYAGYIELQRLAGQAIVAFLQSRITADEALQRLDGLYCNSLTDEQRQAEPTQ
jgi:multiple sugar transport system substrate-binding protein